MLGASRCWDWVAERHHRMRRFLCTEQWSSKERRTLVFAALTFLYMFVELATGAATGSLGLVSDAIHMFCDSLALVLSLAATIMSHWPADKRHPLGFRRYQVLSGFANGVLLLLAVLSIIQECVRRVWARAPSGSEVAGLHLHAHHHHHHDHRDGLDPSSSWIVIGVGAIGLGVNFLGLIVFHDVAHQHGHHGHACGGCCDHASHADHASVAGLLEVRADMSATDEAESGNFRSHQTGLDSAGAGTLLRRRQPLPAPGTPSVVSVLVPNVWPTEEEPSFKGKALSPSSVAVTTMARLASVVLGVFRSAPAGAFQGDPSARGVYLHILADLLGSLGVMFAALMTGLTGQRFWDPLASAAIAAMIFSSAVQLLKDTGAVLLCMEQLDPLAVGQGKHDGTTLSGRLTVDVQRAVSAACSVLPPPMWECRVLQLMCWPISGPDDLCTVAVLGCFAAAADQQRGGSLPPVQVVHECRVAAERILRRVAGADEPDREGAKFDRVFVDVRW